MTPGDNLYIQKKRDYRYIHKDTYISLYMSSSLNFFKRQDSLSEIIKIFFHIYMHYNIRIDLYKGLAWVNGTIFLQDSYVVLKAEVAYCGT